MSDSRENAEGFVKELEGREINARIELLKKAMEDKLEDIARRVENAQPRASGSSRRGNRETSDGSEVPRIFYDTPEQRSIDEAKDRLYQKSTGALVHQELKNTTMYNYTAGSLERNYDVNILSDERIQEYGAIEARFDKVAMSVGKRPFSETLSKYFPHLLVAIVIMVLGYVAFQGQNVQVYEIFFSNIRNQYFFLMIVFAILALGLGVAFLLSRRKEKNEARGL